MRKKVKFWVVIVCLFSMMTSGNSVFAAGYSVLMEPQIDYVDGKITETFEDDFYEVETYFYPTPFNRGFSVVHNNVRIMPGSVVDVTYYDKSSYVVDARGNKVEVGEYDCLGVYSFGFDENPSEFYKGYVNPAFDQKVGVDELGYITVVKNGKGGLIDTQGNEIIPCEYDDLYEAYDLYGVDYAGTSIEAVEYNGKYFEAYCDPYDYLEIDFFSGREYVCYYNGLAVVGNKQGEDAKVGIVDKNDNIVVPFIYDAITPCYDKICWVLKDGKWGIISVDNTPITVKVDNKDVGFDQMPVIINGRTLVPLRAIFEELDATVEWNGKTQTVTSTNGSTEIKMTIGKNEMYVNGEKIVLDISPQIIGERTLVPVRAIAEAFNCDVDWDSETYTVKIKS